MKYLITGGCGFLGSNLSHHILQKNKDELFIIDNLSRKGSNKNLNWLKKIGNFKFFKFNVSNKKNVETIVKTIKPDVIFHLAGQVAMTTSIENPYNDFKTNTLGSINILEAIRIHSPNTIAIYSSTNKVYGDLNQFQYHSTNTRYFPKEYKNGFDENINLSFSSPYGCSKGSADQYFLDYSKIFGLKTVVLRHSSIFGIRQFSTVNQGWIGWFIEQAILVQKNKIETININGDGKQVRDVLFSEDLIRCYFNVIKNIKKCKGQVFNIGGGIENSLSLIELFKNLENQLSIKILITKNKWRESDQKFFVSDNKKIYKFTKWKPKIDYETGIKKMIEWVNESKKNDLLS